MNRMTSTPYRQRGIVMPFAAIAMVVLIGMAGLALDMGHAYVNKTRLQNAVDASALAAAKVLDDTRDTDQATAAAEAIFEANANGAGNAELGEALAGGDITVVVQFSDTLHPFVPGGENPQYVRVRVTGFDLESWLIQVLGITEKTVAASAVAGPSPTIDNACDIAPMMVCGEPDPAAGGGPPYWGYQEEAVEVLKFSSNNSEVGPGNFQLIRLGGPGGDIVRENMAGGYQGCLAAGEAADIETQTGNLVGPVVQGLRTRFGDYTGPMGGTQDQYPPDVIVTENTLCIDPENPDSWPSPQELSDMGYSWADYQSDVTNPANYDYLSRPDGIGAYERRILRIPIGDCNGLANGQSTIPLLGFGCFFLLEAPRQGGGGGACGGGAGNTAYVFGQFIEGCDVGGYPGPVPNNGPGPYIIQLYEDPDSIDS